MSPLLRTVTRRAENLCETQTNNIQGIINQLDTENNIQKEKRLKTNGEVLEQDWQPQTKRNTPGGK